MIARLPELEKEARQACSLGDDFRLYEIDLCRLSPDANGFGLCFSRTHNEEHVAVSVDFQDNRVVA